MANETTAPTLEELQALRKRFQDSDQLGAAWMVSALISLATLGGSHEEVQLDVDRALSFHKPGIDF